MVSGLFAFAPVWEVLISKYSWKGAAWVVSGIVLNGLVIGAIYRPFPKAEDSQDQGNRKARSQCSEEHEELMDNRTLKDKDTEQRESNFLTRGLLYFISLGPVAVLKSPSFSLFALVRLISTVGE